MQGSLRFLTFFLLSLLAFLPHNALACDYKNDKDEVIVKLDDDRGECKSISVSFPKELPSREGWVFSDPFVKLEVLKDNQKILEVNLQIDGSDQKNYSRTWFCLPGDLLQGAVLTIGYDESPTENPKTNKEGVTSYEVSMCGHEIIVDNLDELIALGK